MREGAESLKETMCIKIKGKYQKVESFMEFSKLFLLPFMIWLDDMDCNVCYNVETDEKQNLRGHLNRINMSLASVGGTEKTWMCPREN